MLKEGERLDDLNFRGLVIIQHEKKFKFGMDSVLISNFTTAKKKDLIVDLGCGNGIIPILIASKTEDTMIYGIEIQEDVADMAARSIKINNLEKRIKIINNDIKGIEKILGYEKFDIVTANPPYMPVKSGFTKAEEAENIARYEVYGSLEDFIKTASLLLKFGGKFFMVNRVDRIVDIFVMLRKYNLEPKKVKFVHPGITKSPNLILVESKKGAKPGINILNPLYIYEKNGEYTEEILKIYSREKLEEE